MVPTLLEHTVGWGGEHSVIFFLSEKPWKFCCTNLNVLMAWPSRLMLVRATLRADVDVTYVQLYLSLFAMSLSSKKTTLPMISMNYCQPQKRPNLNLWAVTPTIESYLTPQTTTSCEGPASSESVLKIAQPGPHMQSRLKCIREQFWYKLLCMN